jgi:hypothetical protein
MQNANANLFNEHGLWQKLDALTANKTQPGISFFAGLTTQAQRPGPRDATVANRDAPPGSLQRLVNPFLVRATVLSNFCIDGLSGSHLLGRCRCG